MKKRTVSASRTKNSALRRDLSQLSKLPAGPQGRVSVTYEVDVRQDALLRRIAQESEQDLHEMARCILEEGIQRRWDRLTRSSVA